MKKFPLRTFAAWALGALALVGAITAGLKAGLGPGDWGTWTGGIGTIGTLGFAIYIADAGERRSRAEKMDLARIAAAEFWLTIPGVKFDVDTVEAYLKGLLTDKDAFTAHRCAELLKGVPSWPNEKLATMACLPNHAAAKLAMAATEIQICANDIRLLHDSIVMLPDTSHDSEIYAILASIECIQGYLRDAYNQCDAALVTRVV